MVEVDVGAHHRHADQRGPQHHQHQMRVGQRPEQAPAAQPIPKGDGAHTDAAAQERAAEDGHQHDGEDQRRNALLEVGGGTRGRPEVPIGNIEDHRYDEQRRQEAQYRPHGSFLGELPPQAAPLGEAHAQGSPDQAQRPDDEDETLARAHEDEKRRAHAQQEGHQRGQRLRQERLQQRPPRRRAREVPTQRLEHHIASLLRAQPVADAPHRLDLFA